MCGSASRAWHEERSPRSRSHRAFVLDCGVGMACAGCTDELSMNEVSSAGEGKSANANQKSGSSWRLIKSAQSNETLHGEARVACQEASTLELRAHLLLSARFATYGEHRARVERVLLARDTTSILSRWTLEQRHNLARCGRFGLKRAGCCQAAMEKVRCDTTSSIPVLSGKARLRGVAGIREIGGESDVAWIFSVGADTTLDCGASTRARPLWFFLAQKPSGMIELNLKLFSGEVVQSNIQRLSRLLRFIRESEGVASTLHPLSASNLLRINDDGAMLFRHCVLASTLPIRARGDVAAPDHSRGAHLGAYPSTS